MLKKFRAYARGFSGISRSQCISSIDGVIEVFSSSVGGLACGMSFKRKQPVRTMSWNGLF